MIYLRCPSCNMVIGNRQQDYEQGLRTIEDNPNLTDETKLELKTKLIDSLELTRYCCKMRVITFIQLTDIIK